MIFSSDSANLAEQVTQARADSGLSASTASGSEWSGTEGEQPGKQGRACQQAAELIRKAKKLQRKQAILDAYLDQKIVVEDTAEVNAARLRQKLDKLCAQLPAEDIKVVNQRGDHYLQHIESLCHQKLKRSSHSLGSTAARVAFEAEQQSDPSEGLNIVLAHMQAAVHDHQGPQARRGAMQQAAADVTTVLVYPQHSSWQAECDSAIAKQVRKARLRAPGLQCKRAAAKLNAASSQSIEGIASSYFCDKIVTHWNIGANQGHMRDKLQAMLPLLREEEVRQQVTAAAQACQNNMEALRANKKAKEGRRSNMKQQVATLRQQ